MRITKKNSLILSFGTIFAFMLIVVLAIKNQEQLPVQNQPQAPNAKDEKPTNTVNAQSQPASSNQANFNSPTPTADKTQEMQSDIVLNQFHRVQSQNGKVVWEIKADQGEYSAQKALIRITNGTVWVFKANGDKIIIQAGSALIKMQNMQPIKVEASQGVSINLNDKIEIKTDLASVDKDKNIIHSDAKVIFTNSQFTVSGIGLEGDLEKKNFKLLKDVHTIIAKR